MTNETPYYHICIDGCGAKFVDVAPKAVCPRCSMPTTSCVRMAPPRQTRSRPSDARCEQRRVVPVNGSPPNHALPTHQSHVVHSLQRLVRAGRTFGAVLADPPWPYTNTAGRAAVGSRYPTMTVDEICAEPVGRLLAQRAHVHLWTTTSFLAEALEVLKAWTTQYRSQLVWVKPEMGCGNYWRISHELVLLGVKGNLTFCHRGLRSWFEHPRLEPHSRKPALVRQLIEKVSPGPYLEMYGRYELPGSGWTVYGNAVDRRLF